MANRSNDVKPIQEEKDVVSPPETKQPLNPLTSGTYQNRGGILRGVANAERTQRIRIVSDKEEVEVVIYVGDDEEKKGAGPEQAGRVERKQDDTKKGEPTKEEELPKVVMPMPMDDIVIKQEIIDEDLEELD